MIHWCTFGLLSTRTEYVCTLVLKYEANRQGALAAVIGCTSLLYNASRQMKTVYLINTTYATLWD